MLFLSQSIATDTAKIIAPNTGMTNLTPMTGSKRWAIAARITEDTPRAIYSAPEMAPLRCGNHGMVVDCTTLMPMPTPVAAKQQNKTNVIAYAMLG